MKAIYRRPTLFLFLPFSAIFSIWPDPAIIELTPE
jgi:hypothetical protein